MPMRTLSWRRAMECERRNCFDHLECGSYRAFGVVLMRGRETEIGEHAVAHVARNVAVVAANGVAAGRLKCMQDFAKVFRIEMG